MTALRLPALHALTKGLPARPRGQGELAKLLEAREVPVAIAGDGWPSEMQLLNLRWLPPMDEPLASALLTALLGFYPRIRQDYHHLEGDAALPDAVTEASLRRLIRLRSLTIHAIPHASTPYLGAEFACSWDDEHGLGMLTAGTEILSIGTADIVEDHGPTQAHRDAVLAALKRPGPSPA